MLDAEPLQKRAHDHCFLFMVIGKIGGARKRTMGKRPFAPSSFVNVGFGSGESARVSACQTIRIAAI
jgi:hypothetical protein